MYDPIQHGKRTQIESYYDGKLTKTQQGYEVNQFATRETLLHDVIEALSVLTKGETKKLELEIMVDQQGRYRLIKKWRTV